MKKIAQENQFLGMGLPGCMKNDNPGKSVPRNGLVGGGVWISLLHRHINMAWHVTIFRMGKVSRP